MSKFARLKRVTDLWVKGTTLKAGEDEDGPILVFVAKLNAMERTEAQKDGQFASRKKILSLVDDSDEMALVRNNAKELDDTELLDSLLAPEMSRHYLGARDDVHADPEWAEDLVLIDRQGLREDGTPISDEEDKVLVEVSRKYTQAIDEALKVRLDEARQEWQGLSRDELEAEHAKTYKQLRSFEAFSAEYTITELFYALRDCHATESGNGWSHERCTHSRLCQSREEVHDLPDELVSMVNRALADMAMSAEDAGNSGAPTTSSESSGPQKQQEDSTPSTATRKA